MRIRNASQHLLLVLAVAQVACSSNKEGGKSQETPTTVSTVPLVLRLVYEVDLVDKPEVETLDRTVSVLSKRLKQIPALKGAGVVRVEAKKIVVDLPALEAETMRQTQNVVGRSGKLRIHAVESGSELMKPFCASRNEAALAAGIEALVDGWSHHETRTKHNDCYLMAPDRRVFMSIEEAKRSGCLVRDAREFEGKVECNVLGADVLYGFLSDPATGIELPNDRKLVFESVAKPDGSRGSRSYYVHREASIGSGDVASAKVVPSQGRPSFEVVVDFTEAAGRRFAELTRRSVGHKLAIVIDDAVVSAPIVQSAITGGSVIITFGAGKPETIRHEAEELVSVLIGGELPAAIVLDSVAEIK